MATKKSTALAKKKSEVKVLTPLTQLVEAYLEVDKQLAEMDILKDVKASIKAEILKVFKEERPGEFSSKVAGATVALSVRKTAQVIDEKAVIKQLKADGKTEYISEAVNDLFDPIKKLMASGEQELLKGMAIKETEFISIRSNDKKDPRKLVTGEFVKLKK